TLPNGGGGQRNITFADQSILVVGDGTTDTALDDAGNDWSGLADWVASVQVYGLGGADTIYGAAFSDRLLGNTGSDNIYGGLAADWLYGGRDNDTTDGEGGDDLVHGDLGSDVVRGGAGADTLFGGADNDTLEPGDGDDWGFGGKGDDFYGLTGFAGLKLLYGDDGDDQFDLNGNLGAVSLWGGLGGDEFDVTSHLGPFAVWGGAGDNIIRVAGLQQGGTIAGGDDSDEIHLELQHDGPNQPTYFVDLREGDDDFFVVGVASGLVFENFRAGGGNDHIDLRAALLNDRIVWDSGDGSDTVAGAANGGVYNLGLGNNEFHGSGGRDELRVLDGPNTGYHHKLSDWTFGLDKVRIEGSLYGLGEIRGFRGAAAGVGAQENWNWFVADDKPYTAASFISGFWGDLAAKPQRAIASFFNDQTDAIEHHFIDNSPEGLQIGLIAEVLFTDQNDLSSMVLTGPNADVQSLAFTF
ncbi:MAG: calcium-binding protein, partial [Alphaproteobacteria bacterium]